MLYRQMCFYLWKKFDWIQVYDQSLYLFLLFYIIDDLNKVTCFESILGEWRAKVF